MSRVPLWVGPLLHAVSRLKKTDRIKRRKVYRLIQRQLVSITMYFIIIFDFIWVVLTHMLTAEQDRLQHTWQVHVCVPSWAQSHGPSSLSKQHLWLWRPLSRKCEIYTYVRVGSCKFTVKGVITGASRLLQVVAITMDDLKRLCWFR